MKKLTLSFILLILACHLSAQVDFRKETIYFLITSRFFDGDSTNNAPTEWCSYLPGANNSNFSDARDVTWRGDFKGLIQKLDYIKEMGFTAIWITPVVQNRGPLDYHGYHAWDFTKVDSRLESTGATFQDLINAVHAKGMKIVLDIVTNHSGRFGIKDVAELKYNTDPTKPWGQNLKGEPLKNNPEWSFDGLTPNPDDGKIWSRANLATMPAPYNQNLAAFNWPSTESFVKTSDPNWFHQSGNGFAQGWDDTTNLYQRALADDCPDLNTGSKVVQDYMFNAYKKFLDMGVDAFRWDTWKHMNKEDIFALYDRFKAYKPDLFVFGEVAQKRFDLHSVEEINPHWYTWRGTVGSSAPAGVGVVDFYGEATFHNIFENGSGFSGVTDAARYDNLYSDPSLLITWLDNHDFGPNNDWNRRYGGTPENLAACMNFMFTWRGIPCVYYGTEKQFKRGEYTDIHDASGIQKSLDLTGRAYYGNEFEDARKHKIFAHIKKLNAIRKAIPALQSGTWNWGGNYPGNGIGYIRTLGEQKVAVGLAKDGDANFNFTGLPNGKYVDAVTGRTINVINGALSFSVKSCSAGIYVLNGTGMIGENGAGFFESCTDGCTSVTPSVSISPNSDNYNTPVTVSKVASGGSGNLTIKYTIDGSQPTLSSPTYIAPLTVSANTTVKAIAIDASGNISDVNGQRYTFELPQPKTVISPAPGNYYNPISINLSATNGKPPYTIYYTTDKSEPTLASKRYTQPLTINQPTTVKFFAVDSNQQVSLVKTAVYTFDIPNPTVTVNPAGGNFPDKKVTISLLANSPRMPVVIKYTIDGKQPDSNSLVYKDSIHISVTTDTTIWLKYDATDREGRKSKVDSVKYTFSPIPDIWLYFKKPANWSSPVYVYYWNTLPTGAFATTTWPGVVMAQECPNGSWWKFKFSGVTSLNAIFTDGKGKQTVDLTGIKTTQYYDNGWLTTSPDISKPFGKVSATPTTGTAPLTVNFDASASSGCTQLGYFWDFGNGNSLQTGINATATQTYSKPGTYTAQIVVQDQNDKRDTVYQTITVSDPSTSMIVHFKRPATWTNIPNLYYWNTQPLVTAKAWPGVPMVSEGNGWWIATINGVQCANIIFNNNSSPQTADLYKCGECWYDGGWVSNPLPLRFVSFLAKQENKITQFSWRIANAYNVHHFEIEQHIGNNKFVTVGQHPFSMMQTDYQASIINPTATGNALQFRIKAVDNDGKIQYSNTVLVAPEINKNAQFSVYPNPATDHLIIKSSVQLEEPLTFLLVNSYGQTVYANACILKDKTSKLTWGNGLSVGKYFVFIKNNKGIIKYSTSIIIN